MSPELNETPNPYIGPRAFQAGEKIYGREHETRQLVNLMVAERIVLLYSPSGAGKTSLIQASLIPRMAKMKFQVLPIVRISHASSELLDGDGAVNRYVFSALLSLEEGLSETQRLAQDRLKRMSLADYLAQRPRNGHSRDTDVLIFDQFEEILSLDPTDQEAKREFFRQVGEALTATNRWALFSMREDFIAALDPYLLSVPNRFSTTFRLDLLGREAARLAIQGPAREAGVEFEDFAVDKLVDDLRRVRVQRPDGSLEPQLGPYVEPVQLQVVCHGVWRKLDLTTRRITEADLETVGAVNRSLVDESLAEYYAQRVAATAAETGTSERSIREWFDRHLITEQGIRGNVLMSPVSSSGLDNRAIQLLIDAHLVRAEKRGGATWFELAHDRLIGPVRADNTAWLKTNLSLLQTQSGLWDMHDRPDGLLLRGKDLTEAEHWAANHQNVLLPIEGEFLRVCRQHFERERRTRRLTRLIAILGIISIFLAVFASLAYLDAQRQARAAFTGELAAHASALLDSSAPLSMLLAIEANTIPEAGEQHPTAVEAALRAAVKEPHGQPLAGHADRVNAVAFSPDGRWLATGSGDSTARLWSVDTEGVQGDPLILAGHNGPITSIAFSPDGRWLATGGADSTSRLWDLEAADPSASPIVLARHQSEIYALVFSPDGRWLATGGKDGSALLWDQQANDPAERPRIVDVPEGWIESLAFSPDGRWLAIGGPHAAWLADLNSPDPVSVRPLPGHNLLVQSMAFSPDGRWLATGSQDDTARLWDLSAPDPTANPHVLLSHGDWVNTLAFSPDGRWLATGSGDQTAILWNMESPDPSANPVVLPGHHRAIKTLAFSPDGRWLATGSVDQTIRLWEMKEAARSLNPLVLSGHEAGINSLAFSPDGRWLATGSLDGASRMWDLANTGANTTPIVLQGHKDQVNSLAFNPDGSWLATGSADHTAKLWDMNSSDPNAHPLTLNGHDSWIQVVAFSLDGHWLATGSGDTTAQLWDVGTMDPLTQAVLQLRFAGSTKTLTGHHGEINALAFSPDGRWLATGSADNTARLWDVTSADPSAGAITLTGHQGEINALAFSLDGRWLATGSTDNTARLWDLAASDSSASFLELSGHKDDIFGLAFSLDGRWLATASGDHTARLWNLKASNPANNSIELIGHEDQVVTLAFSPDGRWLATGSWDKTARLWDMRAANPASNSIILSGHENWITSLVFSPDGRWLATGSRDTTAQLWDLKTPKLPGNPIELHDHGGAITSLAFSPDGRWLASGSEDNTSRLWLVQFDELVKLACRSTGRNLSQREWMEYFPGERYHKTCPQWPDGN